MAESLFETIRYGIPLVLLAALLWPRAAREEERRLLPLVLAGGIAGGAVLAMIYAWRGLRTPLEGIVMLAAALVLSAWPLASRIGVRAVVSTWAGAAFLITAQRTGALASFVVSSSRDRVTVVNSELLLFYGGIVLGLALLATAALTLARLAGGDGWVRRLAAAAAILLLVAEQASWGYYALVRHGWFALPEMLFVPVTFLINHVRWFGYAQMGLAVAFGLWSFQRREKAQPARLQVLTPARRRLYHSQVRRQWRYGIAFLFAAGAATSVTAYHKVYANRPLVLTPAERLAAKDGRLVVPLHDLEPGGFRRYAFDRGDGRIIRFFVLKDDAGRTRAAYDACLLCGSKGYLKQGKDLVCLACGAAIYAPTVGREGGCNPIPLAYSISGGNLVVIVDALSHGEGADSFPAGREVAR